ncbi:hypothetical protein BLA29_007165, partial [Euroglyphus maynei]
QLVAVQHIHSLPYNEGHLEKLKSALITTYKPTNEERMHKLLTKSSLDFGQRPSSAFRQMMNWGDGMVDKKLIMSLWSKLLPEHIAPTVSQHINYEDLNDDKIRRIMESADELVARHSDRKYAHEVRNRVRFRRAPSSTSSRSSRSNKSNGSNQFRRRFNPNGPLCYSHFRYRNRAFKCDDPQRCRFNKNDNRNPSQRQSNEVAVNQQLQPSSSSPNLNSQ